MGFQRNALCIEIRLEHVKLILINRLVSYLYPSPSNRPNVIITSQSTFSGKKESTEKSLFSHGKYSIFITYYNRHRSWHKLSIKLEILRIHTCPYRETLITKLPRTRVLFNPQNHASAASEPFSEIASSSSEPGFPHRGISSHGGDALIEIFESIESDRLT